MIKKKDIPYLSDLSALIRTNQKSSDEKGLRRHVIRELVYYRGVSNVTTLAVMCQK
jgi:hypothetical protein